MKTLDVLPFDAPADTAYGKLRAALESAGTPIGATDLFIAAQALSLQVKFVTQNLSEFRRVPGLTVESWL